MQFTDTHFIAPEDVMSVAEYFRTELGTSAIELGAMEPLLWRHGRDEISDLVRNLKCDGFWVALTTNGSLLAAHVNCLEHVALDRIRVSWPSFEMSDFEAITGRSYIDYLTGIDRLIDSELDAKFNRLLLKGHIGDLPTHINWLIKHGATMKLHDLYWTPGIAAVYSDFYIPSTEVAKKHVEDLMVGIETNQRLTRSRIIYRLENGARVEIKSKPQRQHRICSTCKFRTYCIEGFIDYLRIDPRGMVMPCYLRRDLAIPMKTSGDIIGQFMHRWGVTWNELALSKVTVTITDMCNHRCVFPGTNIKWCLRGDA